jgi:hypothetical protein
MCKVATRELKRAAAAMKSVEKDFVPKPGRAGASESLAGWNNAAAT